MTTDPIARLQYLLDHIVLARGTARDETEEEILRSATMHVMRTLHLGGDGSVDPYKLRLLLAIQLSPREAISYKRINPTPRWRLIADYLPSEVPASELEPLARLLAGILDAWDQPRTPTSEYLLRLIRRDGNRCNICRLPFGEQPRSVQTMDPFKPIWESLEELSKPEVDHIIPVSGVGTSDLDNLQVLCRACNYAKGSGLELSAHDEIFNCGKEIQDIPRLHRFRMLQFKIESNGRHCGSCFTETGELTVRLLSSAAAYTRRNLIVTCYDCASRFE